MPSATLASKTFDSRDQALFAELSGDFNPIHMDPLAARRTQAGAPVVHGMHAVLWSLDRMVESGALRGGIASLRVHFAKFIPVGSEVRLDLCRRDDKSIQAELAIGGLTTTVLNLSLGEAKARIGRTLSDDSPKAEIADRPAVLVEPGAANGLSGRMDIADPAARVEDLFPHASAVFGNERIAALALLSRLVGMICPGLHSIFAAFAIDVVETPQRQDGLWFGVSSTDERFRIIRMAVNGAGIDGSVQAFLRWPPIVQASMDDVTRVVSPVEFRGSTALVIGGSRGLGAVTAKVIAAGGGQVVISYASGRREAEELAEEICAHASADSCRIIPYDARQSASVQLANLACDPTHLYYFATTAIARQKEDMFVPNVFDEFVEVYVKGFYDCCRVLAARSARPLTVFYPSSVFVEDGPANLAEYSMAKAAGEILCGSMNRSAGRIHVIVSRLPRMKTDQTATVPPVESRDPLEVMLPAIRKVQSSRFGSLAGQVT
jgi:NAD(P)-dependent dehydrogenase (short-subunit alcohol dehydrogenase family)